MEQQVEGLEVIDNMLEFLPEVFACGLAKVYADEFGFDFDDKEAKEKQLAEDVWFAWRLSRPVRMKRVEI